MTVTAGTSVIGVVERFNREHGIASLTPIYNDVGHGWEDAHPADYPTRGRLFWRGAFEVEPGVVISCRAEHNAHGDDHYVVSGASVLPPVEDMRTLHYADAAEQLRIRTDNQSSSSQFPREVFLWCMDDMVVGPFKVTQTRTPSALYDEFGRLDRVPVRHGEQAILTMPDGKLYCDPGVPPVAFVDCRSDAVMLRTALHDAVEVMKEAGLPAPTVLSTRNHIQQAASQLRVGDSSDDRRNKLARLERALTICSESSSVRSRAAELVNLLLSHPAVSTELEQIRKTTRAEALAEGRRDFEIELITLRENEAQLRRELADVERAVATKRSELAKVEQSVDEQLSELESRVLDRVGHAVDNASNLLAESVLFRALGHAPERRSHSAATRTSHPFSPTQDVITLSKTSEVDQFLRAAASAYGIPHVALRRIHAAFRAGLVPIVTGNGAAAALNAYATTACAGRITSLPVAHDFLSPVDMLGVRASEPTKQRMHADLLPAAGEDAKVNGPAVLVLQSVNQAPTESFLLPWLQAHDRGIAVPPAAQDILGCSRAVIDENLMIAATAVSGTTTAPLTPDIWGFCVAIDVPAPAHNSPGHVTPARVDLESAIAPSPRARELATRITELLDEYWIVDDSLATTARRFGEGLHSVVRGGHIETAIATSVLLPALATSVPGSELDDAAEAVAKWCGTDNVDTIAFRQLVHRFNRRFA